MNKNEKSKNIKQWKILIRVENMIKTLWLALKDNKCDTFFAILGASISDAMSMVSFIL